MRVAVVVGDEELALSVVSLDDVRDFEPGLLQSLPVLFEIGGRPVELDVLEVVRLDRRPGTLVEPEETSSP